MNANIAKVLKEKDISKVMEKRDSDNDLLGVIIVLSDGTLVRFAPVCLSGYPILSVEIVTDGYKEVK